MQFLFFSRSRQNCAFAELWHGFTVDFKRQTQIPTYQKYINRITPELMLHLAGCVFCSRKSKKKPSKLNIYAVCCCVCYGKTIVMLHCSVYFSQNTSVLVSFLWLHLNKPTVIIKMSSWNGWIGGNWWRFEGLLYWSTVSLMSITCSKQVLWFLFHVVCVFRPFVDCVL